ncbi:MAG TPA: hypothetical protein VHC98_03650 [Candidatus Saccharimonadales bacterium]|nr:hypothetical protein [Candidatus Saccharimonadales bacterium]
MIQFNLLPDVKQQYIKTQAMKRLVIGVSFIASAVALVVLILFLSSVYIIQKKSINDLHADIQTNTSKLQSTPHLTDILTVQAQLNSLDSLNPQRGAPSRLFGYLSQVTPKDASISDLKIDYTANTISISGNAPGLDVVNTFVDGLKFTTYSVKGQSGQTKAFSNIVLSSFSRTAKSATYTITLNFDPNLFNNADDVTLAIGQVDASELTPSIIFKKGDE